MVDERTDMWARRPVVKAISAGSLGFPSFICISPLQEFCHKTALRTTIEGLNKKGPCEDFASIPLDWAYCSKVEWKLLVPVPVEVRAAERAYAQGRTEVH